MLPVFVYGLLRPGCTGFAELNLHERMIVVGPDAVAGRLYDLGDYPGLVPGGDAIVRGELLLPLDPDVLAALDRYEEYDPADPEGSEYVRVTVTTLGGQDAWVYAYRPGVAGRAVIPGGEWLAAGRGAAPLRQPPGD